MMSSIVCAPAGEVGPLVHPREHPRQAGGQRVEEVGELAVVKYRLHVLPLADVRELRLGEPRVHQYERGTELAACGHRDDEAAVVAAEETDRRPFVDAETVQPARERRRLVVDLLVGQRPALVDERRQCRDICGHPGSPATPAGRTRRRSSPPAASWPDCRGRGCRCHAGVLRPSPPRRCHATSAERPRSRCLASVDH